MVYFATYRFSSPRSFCNFWRIQKEIPLEEIAFLLNRSKYYAPPCTREICMTCSAINTEDYFYQFGNQFYSEELFPLCGIEESCHLLEKVDQLSYPRRKPLESPNVFKSSQMFCAFCIYIFGPFCLFRSLFTLIFALLLCMSIGMSLTTTAIHNALKHYSRGNRVNLLRWW